MLRLQLFLFAFCGAAMAQSALADAHEGALKREFINPATGYSQAVAVTSRGPAKTVYISGQIGEGEDLESQMRSAWTHLGEQLSASGAEFEDLVKITTFVVNYRPDDLEIFRNVRNEFLKEKDRPASTLAGVNSLALRSWLVEIEAIAVVDPSK